MITHKHSFSLDANLAYPWLMASALLILSCNTDSTHLGMLSLRTKGLSTWIRFSDLSSLCALCFFVFRFRFVSCSGLRTPFVRPRLVIQHLHLNFPIDSLIIVNVVTEMSILSLSCSRCLASRSLALPCLCPIVVHSSLLSITLFSSLQGICTYQISSTTVSVCLCLAGIRVTPP